MKVYGVSVDPVADNKALRDKFDFPFQLLSDEDRSMSLAFGAFLIPLWATHIRIIQEKDRQLARNGEQLSVAVDKLGQMNESGQLEDVDLVDTSIGALIRVRESIKQTSTWPWEASTLRGLLSAVMLPIFLFVVQQILTRFL